MMRRAVILSLAFVAALGAGSAPLAARAQDSAPREWNQARGDEARSGMSAFAPVAAEPTIAWKAKLPGPIVCEPVTWGGIVYVVAQDGRKLTLLAYHARKGTKIDQRGLGTGTWASLAAWQGRVIVCEEKSLRGFPLKAGKLANPWKKKGDFVGGQSIVDGLVIVRDGDELKMFDALKGREYAKTPWLDKDVDLEEQAPYAMLGVRRGPEGVQVAGAYQSLAGAKLYLHVHTLKGVGSKKPKFGTSTTHELNRVGKEPNAAAGRAFILGWMEGKKDGSWLLTGRGDGFGWAGTMAIHPDEVKKRKASDIITPTAQVNGKAYGFAKNTSLFEITANRKGRRLTERGSLPQGARPGPAVSWGGEVCFGNWAMDAATGRTMWVLPDLPEIVTVTPVADSFVMLGTATDELICLAEPDAVVSDNGTDEGVPGAEAAAPPPTDGDGILLRSGVKIAGTFKESGGIVTITPKSGTALEVPFDDVAIGESGGDVTLRGEEPAVLAAWKNVLDGVFVQGLRPAFEAYRKERLLKDARHVLADIRRYNAGDALVESYEASLAGKTENPNSALKKKRLGPIEDKARAKGVATIWEAIEWCEKREYEGAATALLEYAEREGIDDAKIDARAKAMLPEGFPFADDANPGRVWFTWAKAIVPSGGRFLEKNNGYWSRAKNKPWTEDTLGFHTRNVLLFSRSDDINVVGECLRIGEGTVRGLESLLGKGQAMLKEPLDVRVHKNREEYLAERTPDGGQAMPWSAGYYSPAENVSRFYVSHRGGGEGRVPLNLLKTLAHELTHHWLSMRWLGRGSRGGAAILPGYFIVEGFARFMEDQSMEMGRRQGKLDDATVTSLDGCSQVARQDKLLNTAELVAMTQIAFSR